MPPILQPQLPLPLHNRRLHHKLLPPVRLGNRVGQTGPAHAAIIFRKSGTFSSFPNRPSPSAIPINNSPSECWLNPLQSPFCLSPQTSKSATPFFSSGSPLIGGIPLLAVKDTEPLGVLTLVFFASAASVASEIFILIPPQNRRKTPPDPCGQTEPAPAPARS